MTIDEAISHAEEKAELLGCTDCGNEHKQLAEWLKELKSLREKADKYSYPQKSRLVCVSEETGAYKCVKCESYWRFTHRPDWKFCPICGSFFKGCS